MRHKYKTTAFASPLNLFSALFNAPPWFGEWSRLGHNERTPAWDKIVLLHPGRKLSMNLCGLLAVLKASGIVLLLKENFFRETSRAWISFLH